MFKLFKKNKKNKDNIQNSPLEKVIDIISTAIPDVNKKEIKQNSRLEDLGVDSIKFMNLVISFEEILDKDIEDFIDDIDISALQTVNDIVLLMEKLK